MSKPYKDFEPHWYYGQVPPHSYRSIFKWGDPAFVKVPKENLYKMLKEKFHLSDADFKQYNADLGLEEVQFDVPAKVIQSADIAFLKKLYGDDFVRNDDYSRLSVAYGKTMYDLLRLRQKKIENIPDVVVYPDNREQIEKTVAYAQEHHIPLYVYGGGSSVTRGVECMTPNNEVLALAPGVMRPFALCFLALSFNVVACYYFQAILKSPMAFVVSLLRGAVIPAVLLYLLPLGEADLIWYVMPITESATAFLSAFLMVYYTKNLGKTRTALAK